MSDASDRIKEAFSEWGGAKRQPSKDRERFDLLAVEATEAGVPWQDMTQDGYQAPGDLRAGGIRVHYDWKWRADELQRRLNLRDHPE